nr:retrovirus-related Pol polyprotein from transposon TNT 1-94 [Tanacetum cinerariifolium]
MPIGINPDDLDLHVLDQNLKNKCVFELNERAEIQSLPDSYDQIIINLTTNVLSDYLVFDDVPAAILEEENRRNNREEKQTSSRRMEDLVVTRERSTIHASYQGEIRVTNVEMLVYPIKKKFDVFKSSKFTKRARRNQKLVHNGIHSSRKWSGKADKQNLVRKSKSNVGNYKLRKSFQKFQVNEEGDNTTRETTSIQIKKQFQTNNSSEVIPQHLENEITKSQDPTTRTLNRERKRLTWHLDYVMESNVAYFLLTEEGEPSTFQEALNNPDASSWKAEKQEEIEALHKKKYGNSCHYPGVENPLETNRCIRSREMMTIRWSSIVKEERMEMSRIPYVSAVGSLMFAMICTRLDIAHEIGVVSRYMVEPDYACDLDGSKSTTRYAVVAMSTTKAEYVAAAQASKEAV